MSEIFVPKNPIETAKELQWGISMAHPEVADEMSRQAAEIVGDVREIYGSTRLIIHGLAAYSINRRLTFDEQINRYQFNEITVRGHFGGLPFVQRLEEPRLQTFMVDMYNVEILDPVIEEKADRFISVPILFPVLDVETVLIAA